MNVPTSVTDATFDAEVLRNPLPVLADFWAPWCGPCRLIGPIVEELAAEYADRLAVYKLNTDENPTTADRYEIRTIPALLLFKNGEVVRRLVGYRTKNLLEEHLDAVLGAPTIS